MPTIPIHFLREPEAYLWWHYGNTTLETIDSFFTAAPLIDSAICIDV